MRAQKSTLRERVAAALSEVSIAEKELAKLLADLRKAPRFEKVGVTTVVETSFARLRAARAELAKMQKLLG